MFVGAIFDALATGKWYRIERRQVVFFCWMQDSNPGSLEPNLHQTECPLTNRLNCGGWSTKLELNLISEQSAHSTPLSTWFYPWFRRYTCLLVLLLMHRQQGSDIESKGDKLSSSAECRIPKSIRSFIIDCEWTISPESLVMVYGNYPRYMITWRLQVDES